MVKETLLWEEFLRGSLALEKLSKDLEQDWKLERPSDNVGESYLKYVCIRRLSDLIHISESPPDGSAVVESAAPEPQETVPQRSQDSGETELTSKFGESDCLVKCEYHIVYSLSYSVPVMYFNIWQANGKLLTLNEVWSMFRGKGKLTDTDMWSTLSQQDHPVLNSPFFTIHPCHTSRLMGTLWNNSQDPALSYLITWLSIVGGRIGLRIPNELGLHLATANDPMDQK